MPVKAEKHSDLTDILRLEQPSTKPASQLWTNYH